MDTRDYKKEVTDAVTLIKGIVDLCREYPDNVLSKAILNYIEKWSLKKD